MCKTEIRNYKISFAQMNRLAKEATSKKSRLSLEDMRKQVQTLRQTSVSKEKKQS